MRNLARRPARSGEPATASQLGFGSARSPTRSAGPDRTDLRSGLPGRRDRRTTVEQRATAAALDVPGGAVALHRPPPCGTSPGSRSNRCTSCRIVALHRGAGRLGCAQQRQLRCRGRHALSAASRSPRHFARCGTSSARLPQTASTRSAIACSPRGSSGWTGSTAWPSTFRREAGRRVRRPASTRGEPFRRATGRRRATSSSGSSRSSTSRRRAARAPDRRRRRRWLGRAGRLRRPVAEGRRRGAGRPLPLRPGRSDAGDAERIARCVAPGGPSSRSANTRSGTGPRSCWPRCGPRAARARARSTLVQQEPRVGRGRARSPV